MHSNKLFFFISVGLLVVIAGFGFFKLRSVFVSTDIPKTDTNPIVTRYNALPPGAQKFYYEQSKKLTQAIPERLVELDQKNIGCFGPSRVMAMSPEDTNLGGQCCGILKDFEAYELQLQTLHRFLDENEGGDLIPRDPYDLPVATAQKLTKMDSDIALTPAQQNVYDEAMTKSHHGGPCCCKCWKYFMMSGLAKHLIANEGWDADHIAQMWDLSSSCGHAEDTNMHQHYDVRGDSHASP